MISEAFICYLVIATAFSQLYWVLNRLIANPFNQVIPEGKIGTLIYFSMITLSGVGYGGIIPINPYVRLVAALENMIGIFYIAVIVARLVSSYRARATTETASPTSAESVRSGAPLGDAAGDVPHHLIERGVDVGGRLGRPYLYSSNCRNGGAGVGECGPA